MVEVYYCSSRSLYKVYICSHVDFNWTYYCLRSIYSEATGVSEIELIPHKIVAYFKFTINDAIEVAKRIPRVGSIERVISATKMAGKKILLKLHPTIAAPQITPNALIDCPSSRRGAHIDKVR